MSATADRTRDTVRAYHRARFRGDVPAAARTLADRFHFDSPLMASDDAEQHLAGLDMFVAIVERVEVISELFADDRATLVYDVHTTIPVVGIQRTAEHFRVSDGRITDIRLIFDATPWHTVMRAIPQP
ncbi:nuclear transport factor 2 family protein (plasmid) [Embleya sp. NBC_00888]|uniref:nuclear transport factor 2 family protein n=1 Tax=Embleya sp. NBC_00888 TaxID=2975960 RepID=UPI002F91A76F|nr:nuclear transport factor 2 family protein [Embleya sp. NBC_00888]